MQLSNNKSSFAVNVLSDRTTPFQLATGL